MLFVAVPQACSQQLPSATTVSALYFAVYNIICLGQNAHWCLGICSTCLTIRQWTNLSITVATVCPNCIWLCHSAAVQNSSEFLANILGLAKWVALSFANIKCLLLIIRVGDIPVAKKNWPQWVVLLCDPLQDFLHSLAQDPHDSRVMLLECFLGAIKRWQCQNHTWKV